MRLVTAGEICRLLAIERRKLDRWITDGIITPALPSHGRGGRHLFSVVDLLAIALARDLRRRGFSLPDCGAALEALRGRNLADLQREWAAGRTQLVIIGERRTPWLVALNDIPAKEVAAANAAGLRTAAINVEGCFAQLCSELDARARQTPREHTPA